MKNRTLRQNPMLTEILIVLFFFALSACVIVGVFASAYKSSESARSESEALLWAEDFVERFSISGVSGSEYLAAEGWTLEGDTYFHAESFSKTHYIFSATPYEFEYRSGTLYAFDLGADARNECVFKMPAASFAAKKVTLDI